MRQFIAFVLKVKDAYLNVVSVLQSYQYETVILI